MSRGMPDHCWGTRNAGAAICAMQQQKGTGQRIRAMQLTGRRYAGVLLASAFLFTMQGSCQSSGSPLQVTFGAGGIQTLSYNGTTLADLGANPGDNFYIGHMKATDLDGNVLQGGQYGWGEVNNGKQWNAATQTWNYSFS